VRLKPLDLVVLAVALAATAFLSSRIYAAPGGDPVVRIGGSGGEWAYPLSQDRETAVEGPEGRTLVEIRGGRVAIEKSPCRNQTCVLAGAIDRPGQWLACLPNKVFVRIEGVDRGGLDAATY